MPPKITIAVHTYLATVAICTCALTTSAVAQQLSEDDKIFRTGEYAWTTSVSQVQSSGKFCLRDGTWGRLKRLLPSLWISPDSQCTISDQSKIGNEIRTAVACAPLNMSASARIQLAETSITIDWTMEYTQSNVPADRGTVTLSHLGDCT